jgi:hypothetical protein
MQKTSCVLVHIPFYDILCGYHIAKTEVMAFRFDHFTHSKRNSCALKSYDIKPFPRIKEVKTWERTASSLHINSTFASSKFEGR